MKNLQEKIQNIDSNNITEDDISVIESTIQKLDKAKKLNISALTEEEFAALISK